MSKFVDINGRLVNTSNISDCVFEQNQHKGYWFASCTVLTMDKNWLDGAAVAKCETAQISDAQWTTKQQAIFGVAKFLNADVRGGNE